MALIEVQNVTKIYRARRPSGMFLVRDGFLDLFRKNGEKIVALDNISFSVDPGQSIGIIGANGSGKSTLIKILAGVTVPTEGHVTVNGRVASLLELGAGFHPMLTGRENIYLNAQILGMVKSQVDRVFDQIVEFSGIGAEFLDNPVNTYSSGMYVRLGFAVAVHTNPDVFLVDEVLSVGDEEFQRRCRTRIGELREQNKTIVFVSHDLGIVDTLCDRAILLSRGRMISRGTPRATIDFYLRQIGRDVGVHTFTQGDIEGIFCNGRIALFKNRKEVTAPRGMTMNIERMGQIHGCEGADWEIVERRPDGCTCRGRMTRMPVTLNWDIRLADGKLLWDVSIDCKNEVELTQIQAQLMWPTKFSHWYYGDLSGVFPNILPGDLNWASVVWTDPNCREAAAIARDRQDMPPVLIKFVPHKRYFSMYWTNTDYVTGSRALQLTAQLPIGDAEFQPGRHDLFHIECDLSQSTEQLQEWHDKKVAERTLISGPLTGRFEQGRIRFRAGDKELTSFLHFYSSMLIGSFWNDSQHLQWGAVRHNGHSMVVEGESRRFPYTQIWELEPVPEGIHIKIDLDVKEPLEVTEYQASLVLRGEYDRWRTEFESGAYPPFDPAQKDWRHANRIYALGATAEVCGPDLPSIGMKIVPDTVPFRMTAINTGFHESARVLQALRTSETGVMRFEPGRHRYFDGFIVLGNQPQPDKPLP